MDEERLRSIRGSILDSILDRGYEDYRDFSQRFAKNIETFTGSIDREKFVDIGNSVDFDFFTFNEIENPEEFLRDLYIQVERFFSG